MKNTIFCRKPGVKILISLLVVSISFTSCKKDFEELNKDPNGFSTASDGALFNAAVSSLQFGWNEQLYVNVSVLYKETQLAALPQVLWNNYNLGTIEIWNNYYHALPNFRELEKRFSLLDTSSADVRNMMAMEKILLAYKTFKVTDLFGDIPFSEAGYGFQDVNMLRPKFDSQESIYKSLLNDLNWASDTHNIHPYATQEPFKSFAKFDGLFSGDLTKWQKFANSLRLRYAMRMVNKEPVLAGEIFQDIFGNGKPVFGMDVSGHIVHDFNDWPALYPSRLGYRNESHSWSLHESREMRMGTNLWHQLSRNDNTDGSGIFDPRAYYFFETNEFDQWVAFPNVPVNATPDGGDPYKYPDRDLNYNILGSTGDTCRYSPLNYYLIRDMDHQPDILLTGAELLFIRAEAYLLGIGVSQSNSEAFSSFFDGINSSVEFWGSVMNNSILPTTGIPFPTTINVPSNLNAFSVQGELLSAFNAGDAQTKLRMIYSQCMIDMFRQPQEAFALMRRTYMTPHEGSYGQVYRFPIPQSEVSYNQANWLSAVGSSGDNLNRKVWWMN